MMHTPNLDYARECAEAVGVKADKEEKGEGEGEGEGEGGSGGSGGFGLSPEEIAACFVHQDRPGRKTLRVFGSAGSALRAARRCVSSFLRFFVCLFDCLIVCLFDCLLREL